MRASSCVQNWTNSMSGTVGNELHSRQVVLSFRKEGIAQARLLTVHNERVLSDQCSPVLLIEDIAVEPWMPIPWGGPVGHLLSL